MFSRIPNLLTSPRFLLHELSLVFSRKALLLDKVYGKAPNTVKFATFESLLSFDREAFDSVEPLNRTQDTRVYSRVCIYVTYVIQLCNLHTFWVLRSFPFLHTTTIHYSHFGSSKSNQLVNWFFSAAANLTMLNTKKIT